jgi:hypothetical protein
MRNLLIKLAAGAVGGAIATLAMKQSFPLQGRLPKRLQPIMPKKDPGDFLLGRAEKRFGKLSPKLHSGAVQGMPWAYGLVWPLGLAALSRLLRLRSASRTIAAGAALGALVWVIGYEGWLPAFGLTPPAHRVGIGKNATGIMTHVAYGTLASLPLAAAAHRLHS